MTPSITVTSTRIHDCHVARLPDVHAIFYDIFRKSREKYVVCVARRE